MSSIILKCMSDNSAQLDSVFRALAYPTRPAVIERPNRGPVAMTELSQDSFLKTAVISLEPVGKRTKYTAFVIHGDEESRKKHELMGFHDGWGKALDQPVAVAQRM